MNPIRLISSLRFALVIIAALLLLPAACSKQKTPALKRGEVIPSVELVDSAGGVMTLPGALKGKINIVLFWSKGCHYCKKEMPLLEPLYKAYHDKGFGFAAVHIGKGLEDSRMMRKDMGLTFPLLVDDESSLKKKYGIAAVPTMFVYDSKGALKERVLGGLPSGEIEKLIEEALR